MVLTFAAIFGGFAGRLHLVTPEMEIFRSWKLLVLVLPLVAAALMSATTALDLGRRAARYAELAAFLARSRIQLQQVSTAAGLTRVAIAVEKTLLIEIWEWYSLARFSPSR